MSSPSMPYDAASTTPPAQAPTSTVSELGPPRVRDRVLLGTLLAGTAVLYLANITVNGNANTFYAGAAWAGSRNWEALLFGSVDPSNFITVDKPPVSQWIMGLSGQIFGYSSASMLIPEALMGVAAVWLLYATVARVGGRTAGLIAGAALALTPVAAMMFRFNNPDAAMVLLMTAAAYCTVRATARASARWLALAGVALGFAFLAKMLEGIMVLPALGVVYLLAAPTTPVRRLGHAALATGAMIASAGWYVVLTLLWPASSRPYLAGSTDNNFMNLVLGYNGLARIEGHGGGGDRSQVTEFARQNADVPESVAERFGGGMFGSPPGPTRLFSGEFGAEISFLLPTALIAAIVLLVLRGRAPRTDMVRAATILFALWMLVDAIVLSYMSGTTHPYYSLAIAPPIAGLVGLGITQCWQVLSATASSRTASSRTAPSHTGTSDTGLSGTARSLAARFGLIAMILAAGGWGFILLDREASWQPWIRWTLLIGAIVAAIVIAIPHGRSRRITFAGLAVGVACALGAPAALAINADTVAHTGGGPSVLPKTAGSDNKQGGQRHSAMGGFGSVPDSPALDQLLQSSSARWAGAINRTSSASALELDAHVPVMGIGGFSNDPAPSLHQFITDVNDHDIGYYLVPQSSMSSGPGRSMSGRRQPTTTVAIGRWVEEHYVPRLVGGYEVYDLSTATSPRQGSTTAMPERQSIHHMLEKHRR